ncbi:MAG: PP2C family serine/threonine-protein phosphatase [Hyphomicrobiaceae bacterium]
MLKFQHASRATQGARPYQEDASAVWPGPDFVAPSNAAAPPEGTALVAVLADGMGGHAGGALASSTICSTFLASFAGTHGDGRARLKPCLAAANDAIGDKVSDNPQLAGMGATLVGVTIGDAGLSWISVGDSPMYLFRAGELVQLNEDHSLAPVIDHLVEQGRMSPEEARADPRRHYLRSAVTGDEIELVDAPERPLELAPGDIVVIASDGLHTLEPEAVRDIIASHASNGAAAIADALIQGVTDANEPHQDNTTVVVVIVDE